MKSYVALLRGINVGGRKMIKIGLLKDLFESTGLMNCVTYLQSGNVVFNATTGPADSIAKKLKVAILKETSFEVPVLVIEESEWRNVFEGNPFLKERGIDPRKLHVTFLAEAPDKAGLEKLSAIKAGKDRFQASDNLIYLMCEKYGDTKLSNIAIEKALNKEATTRNWTTITAIAEILKK